MCGKQVLRMHESTPRVAQVMPMRMGRLHISARKGGQMISQGAVVREETYTRRNISRLLAPGFTTPPISPYRVALWFYTATVVAYS